MASIYLFSERSKRCVELQSPRVLENDLIQLKDLLPLKLRGLSLNRPELLDAKEEIAFRSEKRPAYVSRYLLQVGEKLLNIGQTGAALCVFDFSSKVKERPECPLYRARALMSLARIDEAEILAQEFLKKHPKNSFAHFLLGRVRLSRDDFQGAESCFTKSRKHLRKEEEPHEEVLPYYEAFISLMLARDALYGLNLNTIDYSHEIKRLKKKVLALKTKIQESNHREVHGMGPYVESLEKLLEHWLAEIGQNVEVTQIDIHSSEF